MEPDDRPAPDGSASEPRERTPYTPDAAGVRTLAGATAVGLALGLAVILLLIWLG